MVCDVQIVYRSVGGDGYWQMRFNNDSGSNYSAGLFTVADDGSTGASARGGAAVTLQRANTVSGESGHLTVNVRYDPANSANLNGGIKHDFGGSTSAPVGRFEYGGYRYRGSAVVTNMLMLNQSAAKTGRLDVICLVRGY